LIAADLELKLKAGQQIEQLVAGIAVDAELTSVVLRHHKVLPGSWAVDQAHIVEGDQGAGLEGIDEPGERVQATGKRVAGLESDAERGIDLEAIANNALEEFLGSGS
jgi:hypothetical protein